MRRIISVCLTFTIWLVAVGCYAGVICLNPNIFGYEDSALRAKKVLGKFTSSSIH